MSNGQDDHEELVETLKLLGVEDAEGWARSQEVEGIPHLAAIVLLKALAQSLVDPRDKRWLRSAHLRKVAGSLRRVKDAKVDMADVGMVVRAMQEDLVWALGCLLDDLGQRFSDPAVERRTAGCRWRLYAIDDEGNPTQPLDSLHEYIPSFFP